jgi:hypothetical protein
MKRRAVVPNIQATTDLDRDHVLQEGYESCGLAFIGKVEIHTITKGFNAKAATVCSVLQNELLQIEKGSLVANTLPDLHERSPGSLTKLGLAFNALLAAYNKYHNKSLLQNCTRLNFFLDRELDFEPHRMRFRPDPTSVHQSDPLGHRFFAGLETTDI